MAAALRLLAPAWASTRAELLGPTRALLIESPRPEVAPWPAVVVLLEAAVELLLHHFFRLDPVRVAVCHHDRKP